MRGSNFWRYLFLLIACGGLLAGYSLQPGLRHVRVKYRLVSNSSDEGMPPEYVVTSALLGGFRGFFITGLWTRAQNMKNEGQYYEMVDIYNIITKLQPNHHNAWAFQAWDLAYNVSVEFNNTEDRVFWVFRGIDLLRKQGIPKNPNIPELYYELAMIFHHKIGQETDYAHPLYRRYLAEQVMAIFENNLDSDQQARYLSEMSTLPRVKQDLYRDSVFAQTASLLSAAGFDIFKDARLLYSHVDRPGAAKKILEGEAALHAVRQAGLWQIASRIRTELSMEPETMDRLVRKYGPIDWRLPYAHALYWASEGYRVWKLRRDPNPTMKYERQVYASLMQLVERGRLQITVDGWPLYVPDYRMLDGVVRHMDEALAYYKNNPRVDGTTLSVSGMVSGYSNFLRSAIFRAFFDGRTTQAERLLNKLATVNPANAKEGLSFFIKQEFKEWINAPAIKDSLLLLDSFCGRAYWHLAAGDVKSYKYYKMMFEYFYFQYCMKEWNPEAKRKPDDPDYAHYLPPILTIRKDALLKILSGQTPGFSRRMVEFLKAQIQDGEPLVWKAVEFELAKKQKQEQLLDVAP